MHKIQYLLFITLIFSTMKLYADKQAPKLHPIEKACVEYQHEGMLSGTSTRCHRKFAYEQYEIEKLEMKVAGFVQEQNKHTITIGDTIYAINKAQKTGTKTKNPMYEQLANGKDGRAEDTSKRFMEAMGFTPTGETKTIQEHTCDVHQSPQMGMVCMHKGLMLEQSFFGNTLRAVKVSIGDGGNDAHYDLYKMVSISEGPDLSQGLQGLQGLLPPQ